MHIPYYLWVKDISVLLLLFGWFGTFFSKSFFWYAVNTNLFPLVKESTNPKKNSQTMDAFWQGAKPHTNFFFFQKCSNISEQKIFLSFFFKSFQIYMTDAESAESKEKSNFRFLFFRIMVIFVTSSPQFSMNFFTKTHLWPFPIIFISK